MRRATASKAGANLIEGIPQTVAEQAVKWMIELREAREDTGLHQRWRAWREADPDHERAWRRIEQVNASLAPLHALESGVARAALATPGPARRRVIKTLTLALFGAGAVAAVQQSSPWRIYRADYRTAMGEQQDITLADGTRIALNTDSAFDVVYSPDERRLRLLTGEMLVTTAHAAHRPFTVETRDGQAQALGTRFLVRQFDDATLVAVYEGAVRVLPRLAPDAAQVLQAGQQARCSTRGILDQRESDATALAWTQGSIVADGMRLTDLVAELARYTDMALLCAPEVSDLRVSGSYPVENPRAVLDALASMLNLEVQPVRRFWGATGLRIGPRGPSGAAA